MGRILAIVLGLGVVVGAAWYVLRSHTADPDPGNLETHSEAKRTLDNVHKAADRVEQDMQRRVEQDDQMQKAAAQ